MCGNARVSTGSWDPATPAKDNWGTYGGRVMVTIPVASDTLFGSGQATLKEAINEAMRDWVTNPDSYYLLGSALGPHPYPTMVRDFQAVIGVVGPTITSTWSSAGKRLSSSSHCTTAKTWRST